MRQPTVFSSRRANGIHLLGLLFPKKQQHVGITPHIIYIFTKKSTKRGGEYQVISSLSCRRVWAAGR